MILIFTTVNKTLGKNLFLQLTSCVFTKAICFQVLNQIFNENFSLNQYLARTTNINLSKKLTLPEILIKFKRMVKNTKK